ncbi:MAG: hypothetical protein AAF587_14920 [Bacteroidota bacterium]
MHVIQGLSLMLLGFFLNSFSIASAQQVSSTERAVYGLMDAGFLSSYKDHRSEIEERVAIFKSKKDDFSVEDLIRMKSAYKRTSEAFEDFIYGIRNDLLDKKVRKKIKKDSEGYVTQQMEKLNTIYVDYYQGWFQPTYSSISDPSSTVASNRGSGNITIPSALIAPVSQATMNVIEYLDKKNEKDLETVKKVLDREWVDPHQFTPWEEI